MFEISFNNDPDLQLWGHDQISQSAFFISYHIFTFWYLLYSSGTYINQEHFKNVNFDLWPWPLTF